MYEGSHFGAHSYSTPASPSSYNNSNNNNNNNSQPSEGKVGYDKDLAALFRATAANVTQLYKEASDIGNSAYKAGYEQCYHDVCEYLLATSQTEGTVSHADVQQLVMQRLTEFSRLKRIGPRQVHLGGGTSRPPSASSQVYGHQSYSYGQHDHQQNHDYQQQHQQHQQQQQQQHHGRHSLNTQGSVRIRENTQSTEPPNPNAEQQIRQGSLASHEALGSDSAEMAKFSEQCHGRSLEQPSAEHIEALAGYPKTPEGEIISDQIENQGTVSSILAEAEKQQPIRTKRALDASDLMEIEPPKRRQRKDDVDMV